MPHPSRVVIAARDGSGGLGGSLLLGYDQARTGQDRVR